MNTAKYKQIIRALCGDRIAGWMHAGRLAWLALTARQEAFDLEVIQTLVRPGGVAVDVGANGADWTRCFSKLVGLLGHVYAFEADPYYAEVTRKTIVLLRLKNVTFFPYGLSDRQETTLLRVLDEHNARVSGTGRVVRGPAADTSERGACVPVELVPLDSLTEQYPDLLRTTVMKCDVEGFELMVFRGARNVLAHARPVIIAEVGGAEQHDYSNEDLFRFFQDLNYESYVAVSQDTLRTSREPGAIPEGPRPNRIMIPREMDLTARGIHIEGPPG